MAIYVKTDSGADLLSHDSNNIISDKFSESTSYSSGDYCIYNNTLYQFTADKSAGAWDSSVVEETTVANELSELNSDIDSVGNFETFASISASAASGVATPIAEYTTPELGTYLFIVQVYFSANSSGYRQVYSSRTNYAIYSTIAAASGFITQMHYVDAIAPSPGTTTTFYALQNSGSTLTVSGYFRVVRIK